MSKLRVHELARELGRQNREVIEFLKSKGVDANDFLMDALVDGGVQFRRMQEMIRILQTEYWFMPRCRKQKNRESSSTEALVWEG